MTMDAQYFINKFTAITEDRWTIKTFSDRLGRCCAMGHCGGPSTDEAEWLEYRFRQLGLTVFQVNDGSDPRYQQPTPKQRILAALRDAKERGL